MNNSMIVLVLSMWYGLISQVAISLGVTTSFIERPERFSELHPSSGFSAIVDGFMTVVVWVVNNIGSLVQLMFFQTDIHPLVNVILFTPLALTMGYIVLKLARG